MQLTEERNVDSLHNEKIVELLEIIENLKVEITSRDTKVEYLESYIKKQSNEILDLRTNETNSQSNLQKTASLKNTNQRLQNELTNQAHANQATLNKVQDDELSRGGLLQRIDELEEKLANNTQKHKVIVEQLNMEIGRIQE